MRFASVVAATLAAAAAQDLAPTTVPLVTFDGASGTTFKFQQLNDPVMGGKSSGTWEISSVDDAAFGVMDGEVVDVPKLMAPGFITAAADGKFNDASATMGGGLLLEVRSTTADYTGFRVSFAAGTMAAGYACAGGGTLPFSRGCFKADFSVPAGEGFSKVYVPFTAFSDMWDPKTGDHVKNCEDDASVCPDTKALAGIVRAQVWAEGVSGSVHLEVRSITAVSGAEAETTVEVDEKDGRRGHRGRDRDEKEHGKHDRDGDEKEHGKHGKHDRDGDEKEHGKHGKHDRDGDEKEHGKHGKHDRDGDEKEHGKHDRDGDEKEHGKHDRDGDEKEHGKHDRDGDEKEHGKHGKHDRDGDEKEHGKHGKHGKHDRDGDEKEHGKHDRDGDEKEHGKHGKHDRDGDEKEHGKHDRDGDEKEHGKHDRDGDEKEHGKHDRDGDEKEHGKHGKHDRDGDEKEHGKHGKHGKHHKNGPVRSLECKEEGKKVAKGTMGKLTWMCERKQWRCFGKHCHKEESFDKCTPAHAMVAPRRQEYVNWCCKNEGKMCKKARKSLVMRKQCLARMKEWKAGEERPMHHCCRAVNVGCKLDKFNCFEGNVAGWEPRKQRWCCRHKDVCEEAQRCDRGTVDFESAERQARCCEDFGVCSSAWYAQKREQAKHVHRAHPKTAGMLRKMLKMKFEGELGDLFANPQRLLRRVRAGIIANMLERGLEVAPEHIAVKSIGALMPGAVLPSAKAMGNWSVEILPEMNTDLFAEEAEVIAGLLGGHDVTTPMRRGADALQVDSEEYPELMPDDLFYEADVFFGNEKDSEGFMESASAEEGNSDYDLHMTVVTATAEDDDDDDAAESRSGKMWPLIGAASAACLAGVAVMGIMQRRQGGMRERMGTAKTEVSDMESTLVGEEDRLDVESQGRSELMEIQVAN